MQWSFDRTGFPVLELPDLRLAVHLLPVVKQQFERFLAEPGPFGDSWYEELLALSPRIPLAAPDPELFESLFLGGIHPNEIPPFARWLGQGFDLPTADAWRTVDRALATEPVADADASALRSDGNLSPAARHVLGWLIDHRKPQTWSELLLMRGGLLEWVKAGPTTFGAFGVPRPEFQALIVNPQRDPPVRPIDAAKRYRYFGFRLVRSM